MDPVSVIVAAVAAGAVAGVTQTATQAVKDAYAGLKRLVSQRLGESPAGVTALVEHEQDPATWEAPLRKGLEQAGAGQDDHLLAAAQALLGLADPQGSAAGKYVVDVRGAQGVQVGDHTTQTDTFDGPAPFVRGTYRRTDRPVSPCFGRDRATTRTGVQDSVVVSDSVRWVR